MAMITRKQIKVKDVKPGDPFMHRSIYQGCAITRVTLPDHLSIRLQKESKQILCVVLYDGEQFDSQDSSYTVSGSLLCLPEDDSVDLLELKNVPKYETLA